MLTKNLPLNSCYIIFKYLESLNLVWRCLLGSAPHTSATAVVRYLVYLADEPFVPLCLASSWCLMLLLQPGSAKHSPLLVPLHGMDSPWKFASCLRIMKVCSTGCLRLTCIAMAGLRAPLSRYLEVSLYKFLNE